MSIHVVFECGTPLPVLRYGGTERIIYWLMKELVRRGYRVSLLGPPESHAVKEIGVNHIPVPPGAKWVEHLPSDPSIIHLFSNVGEDLERALPCPVMVTIQGNGKPGEVFPRNTVFISKKHAENHGATDFVYNGVDLKEFPDHAVIDRERSWGDFLFLAKARWKVKNLESCIRVCKRARKHLHVAGGRLWSFSRWIHSYGMVDQAKKLDLLSKCDALLFPVRWDEPFGIAMIEAMAMGVPVIGSPYGSLPEVIGSEGGWVVKSESEMLELVSGKRPRFDPLKVRKRVEDHFSSVVMTSSYMDRYERVLRGEFLQSCQPITRNHWQSERLLEWTPV